MQYTKRTLERKFISMSGFFKAVLVTGARQVGKTTMLKQLAQDQNRSYDSLTTSKPVRWQKMTLFYFFKRTSLQ